MGLALQSVTTVQLPIIAGKLFQGPKYQEIVNIRLGDGTTRRGQVLEVDGEKAVVQVHILSLDFV